MKFNFIFKWLHTFTSRSYKGQFYRINFRAFLFCKLETDYYFWCLLRLHFPITWKTRNLHRQFTSYLIKWLVVYFKQSPIIFSNFPTYLFNYVVILSVYSPGKLSVCFFKIIYYDSPFPVFGLCSLSDPNIQNFNTRTYYVDQIHQRCQHLLRINLSPSYWECSSS